MDLVEQVKTVFTGTVDVQLWSFQYAVLCIVLAPTIWNILARTEYYTHWLTKVAGGPYNGCYVLTVWIFGFSSYRDWIVHKAQEEQLTSELLAAPMLQNGAYVAIGLGSLFVLSSYYRLGITGTFLGDYFGILMSERVTAFPFNVLNNPMYVGSTMCFTGTAILNKSPAGLVLALIVYTVYMVALMFEEPFTGKIYAEKAKGGKKTPAKKTKRTKKD